MQGNFIKRSCLLSLSLVVMSLATISPAIAGNFSHTCRDISISGGHLTAICRTANQAERNTGINLDRFIGNIDGQLTWGEHNFSHSCTRIYVDNNRLKAICRTMDGQELKGSLNLDRAISNINGKLRFDD